MQMKSLERWAVFALLLLVIGRPAAGDEAPKSKLGVNYLTCDDGITLRALIETGRLPIFRVGIDQIKDLIPYYKQHNPNGIAAVGMVSKSLDYAKNPEDEARKRWDEYLSKKLLALSPEQKALIDYLEVSPNMTEPHSVAEAQWWNRYAEVLCKLVGEAGFKPMILTIGVGGIPCSNEKELAVLEAVIPALRAAHKYGGGWAYHGYTLHYTMDVQHESLYSLRYRRAYELFKAKAPDLMTMPIVLGEGGVDYRGDPDRDGYAYRGSREDYAKWLYWYDQEIKKDPYVVGVALFQIGGGKWWSSFNLDPMLPWFINYYKTGDPNWPQPPTKLGMFVFSEKRMSPPVKRVCASKAPLIYTGPSEIRPGGAIETYKKANPNGLVVVRMRSALPTPQEEPDPEAAARKRWDAIAAEFVSRLTDKQRTMVDFVDATPDGAQLQTKEEIGYVTKYMNVLAQRLLDNGFRPIIAAFDARTLPITREDWGRYESFKSFLRDKGRRGGALIYHADVTSYTKDVLAAEAGILKHRQMYRYLLKFSNWLLAAPVIIIPQNRCSQDGQSGVGTAEFREWLTWLDSEACKDPDVLGIALYKVGRPETSKWSDLSALVDWYVGYVNERAPK